MPLQKQNQNNNNIIRSKNHYENLNYIITDNNNINNMISNNSINNLILQRNTPLKNDINKLDNEIKLLQDKLKFLIDDKNTI